MEIKKNNAENLKRWQHNRLGMFIHWGLYAMPARHEWVRSHEKMPESNYLKYFENFNPDLYNPGEWAKLAKSAGMKYVVLTTKHHDGFCLWDSKYTDWKSTKTPYGKDLLKPFVEAFRAEGIRVGLYHSLLDWHHPDYTTDRNHPMRDDEAFKAADAKRDMHKYAEYLHHQVAEILTNYGEVDCIFFDFSIKDADGKVLKGREAWNSEELAKLCRKLQPQILINDRLELDEYDWGWDYMTPEQCMLRKTPEKDGVKIPWETCQTFSGAWGYFRDEYTWKSVEQLIKMLVDTVSKGGNLLLNVGPTARGEFDPRAKECLAGMGGWMNKNERSIYGCIEAPEGFERPEDCRLTFNPETNKLYIHVFSWPPTGELYIEGSRVKEIKYAQLLNDGSELKFGARAAWQADKWRESEFGDMISLKLPVRQPGIVPVIELILQ
ncbi:MAG: alpha-L-fucosidase [Lentisphaerae bacterium GWF2_45_14]|nr:MAG: alpha-L-fucosidase [Lentisphaerae bacterium GWF2_45_14]